MAISSQSSGGHSGQIYEEVYLENGRWYGTYRKGKYMFPIDETELERLDLFHKIFLVARKDLLHSAPIHSQESPRILDLGCGTGIWGIEMADKYPGGMHVGLDLNYIQPEFIPANMHFLQRDIEDKWQDLEPSSWDLIHMRTLNGSISNWPELYAETFKHLKPAHGYIEHVEIDWSPRCEGGTLPRDAHVVQWANQLLNAMDGLGRSIRLDSYLIKRRLADAGFVDIKEEVIRLPLNGRLAEASGRHLSRWFNLGIQQACQPLSLAPLSRRCHGWTVDEIQDLSEKVRVELRGNTVHAHCTLQNPADRSQAYFHSQKATVSLPRSEEEAGGA